MRSARWTVTLLGLLLVGLPAASAAECVTGVGVLCDTADEYNLGRLFGDYGDVGLALTALFVIVLVITTILIFVRLPVTRPKITTTAREPVKEIAPGETVQLIVDVENRRRRTSVDVGLEVPDLPEGWTALGFGATAFSSGFTAPQALPPHATMHLSSRERGNHKGAVATALTASREAEPDDHLELVLRVIPVTGGVPRWGRSRRHRFTMLVSRARALVQITNVAHTPERIVPGQSVTTRATVANEGNAEAMNVGINFLLNDQVVESKTVPIIDAKQETVLEFNWTPLVGENRIRIHVV